MPSSILESKKGSALATHLFLGTLWISSREPKVGVTSASCPSGKLKIHGKSLMSRTGFGKEKQNEVLILSSSRLSPSGPRFVPRPPTGCRAWHQSNPYTLHKLSNFAGSRFRCGRNRKLSWISLGSDCGHGTILRNWLCTRFKAKEFSPQLMIGRKHFM